MMSCKHPSYLILFVTADCESECRTCFNRYKREQKINVLSMEEIRALSSKYGRLKYLSLSGGEPFMRENLSEICKSFYVNNGTRFIDIPTNGMMSLRIKETVGALLEECPDAIVQIDLSLDGIGRMHDYIRGVKGSFEKLIRTYTALSDMKSKYKKLKLNICTTYNNYNQNNILDIFEFAKKEMPFDRFSFAYMHGSPYDPIASDVDQAEYFEIADKIDSVLLGGLGNRDYFSKLMLLLHKKSREILFAHLEGREPLIKCRAGDKFIVISEEGELLSCEGSKAVSFGNLRNSNYDVSEILNSEKCRKFKKYLSGNGCSCTWMPGAVSSLVWTAGYYPGIIFEFIKKQILIR